MSEFLVSAFSSSGHFPGASVLAEALWRYRSLDLSVLDMVYALIGSSGGMVVLVGGFSLLSASRRRDHLDDTNINRGETFLRPIINLSVMIFDLQASSPC